MPSSGKEIGCGRFPSRGGYGAVIVTRLRFPKRREDSPRFLAHVSEDGRVACLQWRRAIEWTVRPASTARRRLGFFKPGAK
jgi:hypothetical protein